MIFLMISKCYDTPSAMILGGARGPMVLFKDGRKVFLKPVYPVQPIIAEFHRLGRAGKA